MIAVSEWRRAVRPAWRRAIPAARCAATRTPQKHLSKLRDPGDPCVWLNLRVSAVNRYLRSLCDDAKASYNFKTTNQKGPA